MTKLKPCPKCKDSWLYEFTDRDNKHHFGYTVNCKCGYAWQESFWKATKEEATEAWNRKVEEVGDTE